MPIAISHNNEYINDAMKQMPNKNAVNPADQDPTTTSSSIQKNTPQDNKETALSTSSSRDIHNTTTTLTTTTTTAYDQFSFADQEASKLFPVNERRRKSIAVTGATPRPQLDSLVGQSLDTRRRSSMARNSFIADPSRHHETNSEDEQEGPMVPPHILAASTYTDETEELFGAVPRSNTWRKTYD
ncbi:hypothetical protein BDA99DRAFT_521552 [Phascolomyces articulosus]|uniref:Uncharacterized protein n=1 Tax=Phascolomyces articulosus TaxID=60185 RepID=A0AAD5JSB4_9FUNG|nr:hypothetical protein BDA99DRAFT_521552 [Phascolomyces articulosus]